MKDDMVKWSRNYSMKSSDSEISVDSLPYIWKNTEIVSYDLIAWANRPDGKLADLLHY